MIPLAWDEIASLELGALRRGSSGDVVNAIRADSREVGPGELFVALNTGVAYVEDALARGAATLVRGKSAPRVVAVVGSTGKTSTKDVLGALCAPHARTIWAERSLNNEIGLPLTVLRLEPDTDILVTEMGMRGRGQIAALCEIAQPHVAVVTHVGPEHLELLGTVEEVAAANAEAIAALPAAGTAVVPADAPALEPYLTRTDIVLRRFDPNDAELESAHGRFRVDGTLVELELPFAQRHHAVNTLAALHAYAALGLPLDRAAEGAAAIRLSPWRGEEHDLAGGVFVVNDAYNANPTSMRAALEDLAKRAGTRRKVAVLGEMAELGAESPHFHESIARLAAELGIEVIGVGEPARAYDPVAWAADAEDALEVARAHVRPGDAVLVKASRAVGLEGIAPAIANIARE